MGIQNKNISNRFLFFDWPVMRVKYHSYFGFIAGNGR